MQCNQLISVVMVCWLATNLTARAAASEPASTPSAAPPTEYMIIVTGEELLRGVYPDGHTCFLTRTLRPLGCRCVGSMCVDDNRDDLKRALGFAVKYAPLVIVTGGLGPTANDITRETLADFTGIPLREQPEVLAEMERRFHQSARQTSGELAPSNPGAVPRHLSKERQWNSGRFGV